MKTTFTTVVSADNYQNYIPLYCHALRAWFKDDINIFLRGQLSTNCAAALPQNDPKIRIIQNAFDGYPFKPSTTNALRFIVDNEILSSYDYCMITDIDLLILQDPWAWHLPQITKQHPFSGYHGATRKPVRSEICRAWAGLFERVAGGYFCVGRPWWQATLSARTKYSLALADGRYGVYREQDEVMLARIIKDSKMQVPKSKFYPRELRGIHLGDFKFKHRWTNMNKMLNLLTDKNVELYWKLIETKPWQDSINALQDKFLNVILERVLCHIKARTCFSGK